MPGPGLGGRHQVDWPSLRAAVGGPVTGAVQVGTPPGGDYVPVGMAGLGYTAP